MYIWLREEVDIPKGINPEIHQASGKKYVSIKCDLMDVTITLPTIPDSSIERVTAKDVIEQYRGFRQEGIYRYKGAVLVVKTKSNGQAGMDRQEWQEVNVSAPTVVILREIYTLVRQGKLSPDENWEVPASQLPKIKLPDNWERN